jgi:hypothetical protein
MELSKAVKAALGGLSRIFTLTDRGEGGRFDIVGIAQMT